MSGQVRIGISGWRYAPWRGEFYPRGLRQADELAFAARHFNTIELNGSFYSLQRPELYAAWRAATPPGFVFAVKGSRYITHMRRLRDVETPLANFLASGVLCLAEKLGPLLWQFPPTFQLDERFEPFLAALPRTTADAAEMAKRHDSRVPHAAVVADESRELRHAVEIRHVSFCTPEFVAMLRRQKVALVIADTAGHFPYLEDLTANFVYLRLHGDEKLYESGYTPRALRHWAARVNAFSAGREGNGAVRASPVRPVPLPARDVYVYFDNDIKVHAPFDAQTLARLVHSRAPRVAQR
jgi:uncharacterized protein YecE (DUF72 family)